MIQYHIGLDFKTNDNDLIIIDEADQLILSDPQKFYKFSQRKFCICLTATADNKDQDGVNL